MRAPNKLLAFDDLAEDDLMPLYQNPAGYRKGSQVLYWLSIEALCLTFHRTGQGSRDTDLQRSYFSVCILWRLFAHLLLYSVRVFLPFFVGHRNLNQALDQAVVLNDETESSRSPVWKVLDPD